MNSIDNLREYVLTAPSICSTTRAILVGYIDGIEREVDDMWHALTIDAKPMTDENMAESGWVRLPVDADGVPIHVGETVTCMLHFGGESKPFVVDRMELGLDGDGNVWSVALDRSTDCWEQPLLLRHHHAPTVEDVLREFADAWAEWKDGAAMMNPVETFAAKLRLVGDE